MKLAPNNNQLLLCFKHSLCARPELGLHPHYFSQPHSQQQGWELTLILQSQFRDIFYPKACNSQVEEPGFETRAVCP